MVPNKHLDVSRPKWQKLFRLEGLLAKHTKANVMHANNIVMQSDLFKEFVDSCANVPCQTCACSSFGPYKGHPWANCPTFEIYTNVHNVHKDIFGSNTMPSCEVIDSTCLHQRSQTARRYVLGSMSLYRFKWPRSYPLLGTNNTSIDDMISI